MCFRPSTASAGNKQCPKCQKSNLPEADVCIQCGAELPDGKALAGGVPMAGAPTPPKAFGGVTPPKAPPAPPKVPAE